MNIVKSAIVYKNECFAGYNHEECFVELFNKYDKESINAQDIELGFLTNTNEFVSREEAMFNAVDSGQIRKTYNDEEEIPPLTSEEMHICWLHEKDKEIERLKVFEKAYYYNQLQASQEDIQKFQQFANQSAININYIAIQELEKVKDRIKHFCEIHSDDYYGVKSQVMGIRQDVFEFIDQQIKQLGSE